MTKKKGESNRYHTPIRKLKITNPPFQNEKHRLFNDDEITYCVLGLFDKSDYLSEEIGEKIKDIVMNLNPLIFKRILTKEDLDDMTNVDFAIREKFITRKKFWNLNLKKYL